MAIQILGSGKCEDSITQIYAFYTDPKEEFCRKSSNHLVHTTNIEHLNYHRPQTYWAPWRCERSCLTCDMSSNGLKTNNKSVDKNKTTEKTRRVQILINLYTITAT